MEIPITIGLCVKNAENTIRNCIQSILNQQYPKRLVEIIVVDGKSKDKTIQIAERLISLADFSVRFYSDEGKGLGVARQIVLDNTNSKYVIWVDSDVVISENFVQSQVEFMEKHPKVAVATGMYFLRQGADITLPALLQSLAKLVGSCEFKETSPRGLPPNDASIYRVEPSKRVGGFDKCIKGAAEDEDIILRMRKKGWLISVNRETKFSAFTRQSWRDVWSEAAWFGYGKHYLGHKYKNLHVCMYSIPLINFYVGIRTSLKAYRLTSQPKSFLLPFAYVFSSIAWWFGFLKAHLEGYGHV
jgi:glycosyltransferase involved in cell wall biosynthesis